jgi:hypothetical protein
MHPSIVSSDDGSVFSDMLCFNPRQFFGARTKSIQQVFDFKAMRRWLDHLRDVNEIGLPKAMVRA